MRARQLIFVPALLTVALVTAGCGGGGNDDQVTATGVPTASTPSATVTSPVATGSKPNTTVTADDSISQQISKNPDLRTLSTAINAAGLAGVLDSGRYTVFAPTNDAFTALGSQLTTLLQPDAKADLTNVLKFHILKGKIKTKKLRDDQLLTTLQGTRLRVKIASNGTISVGNKLGSATILVPNAKASNGIIHTVDTVLQPKKK